MPRDAVHMVVMCPHPPSAPTASVPVGASVREVRGTDAAALGDLFWAAYLGTIDDEYATPDEAAADAADTLTGKWGPLVGRASLVAEIDATLVATVIVVLNDTHAGELLLAYALTTPAWQGRGIGRRLIEESMARLALDGPCELHLAVTRGNPAARLYERLGFRPFAGPDPSGADPRRGDPSGADPSSADPSSADPSGADPSGADPSGADPSRAVRRGSRGGAVR